MIENYSVKYNLENHCISSRRLASYLKITIGNL